MAKILKQKDINLLHVLEKGGTTSAEAQKKRRLVLILAMTVLVVAVISGLFFLRLMSLENKKEKALSYIEDPTVVSAYDEASQKQEEAIAEETRAGWLKSLLATIDGYPRMNADKFSQIFGYAGSRIEINTIEYDSSTAILTFDASSDSATGVPIFIAQLRMSGIFEDVNYEGYKNTTTQEITGTIVNPDGTISDDMTEHERYSFIVNCLVKAGE